MATADESYLNIAKAPNHHRKLLEVVAALDAALTVPPHSRFYVTGGAAAAYYLPDKGYPINDIDCVCLTDTKEAREFAIEKSMFIVKVLLEGVTGEAAVPYLTELGAPTLSPLGFNSNRFHSANYNPYPAGFSIPADSPFTGVYYYDKIRKIYVISVRHRVGTDYFDLRPLLDISIPSFSAYPGFEEKWKESEHLPTLTPLPGLSIHVLGAQALLRDQAYAAEHNTRPEKISVRTQRAKNLRDSLEKRKGPSVPPGGLPVVKARLVSPSVARTGGSSSVTSAPASAPTLSIYPDSDGRVYLNDHRVRRSWPARESYDPYKPATVYSFETGASGPIGDYWLHSDGRYQRYPPSS